MRIVLRKGYDRTHLSVLPKPTDNVKYGTSDLWNVQYQVANVAAKTISPKADMKNTAQKKPTKFQACNQKKNHFFLGEDRGNVVFVQLT